MSATTHAKPGRKKDGRRVLDDMLRTSEAWTEACDRAKKEKRPVEFVLVYQGTDIRLCRKMWAWPDGHVTSPGKPRSDVKTLTPAGKA